MEPLSYEMFGEELILAAVTPERVVTAIKHIAGETVSLGPLRAGPAGAASVVANGDIGEPIVDELTGEGLRYSVRLPVRLTLEVRVGAVGFFEAEGAIEMALAVRTVKPLAILIEVEPVRPHDVNFNIRARGVQSRLLQRAGDVERELRHRAAAYVNEQAGRPEAARFTRVELLPLIEAAWSNL